MATFDEIRSLKKRHSPGLLKKPGVCGVDIDVNHAGQAILTVHLDTADPAVREQLPDKLEGYPIRYVHTGPFRKE
jgi:hypothetical protein